jgi:hypothetical protein
MAHGVDMAGPGRQRERILQAASPWIKNEMRQAVDREFERLGTDAFRQGYFKAEGFSFDDRGPVDRRLG